MDELPPGYFYCEKARCTLSRAACIGRQDANERRKGFQPIPFAICLKCPQGVENRLLPESKMNVPQAKPKPTRGNGHRHMECEHYNACLSKAAGKDWKTWHCSDTCPYYHGQGKGRGTKPAEAKEKKPNTRICKDCNEKPTLSENCPYCPSCMAKRSNKAVSARKQRKESASKAPKTTKTAPSVGKATEAKPAPNGDVLTIDFGQYGDILRRVEKLAVEELRSTEMQAIYMLKKQLDVVQG